MEKRYEASLYRSSKPEFFGSDYGWKIYVSAVKNCCIFRKSVESFIKEKYKDEVKLVGSEVVRFDSNNSEIDVQVSCESNSPENVFVEEPEYSSIRKIDISSFVDGRPPHVIFTLRAKPGYSLKAKFKLSGFREPNILSFRQSELPGR